MRERDLSTLERLLRLPLASLGFVVLALLIFLNVQIQFRSELQEARKNFRDAIDLSTKNPILELQPRFLQVMKSENSQYVVDDTFSFLQEKRDDNPDLSGPTKQEKLNIFVIKAFGNLDAHPTRTLGIVPGQNNWLGYFVYPFVHAGWIHFLTTALLILVLAPPVELLWGRKGFPIVLGALVVLSGIATKVLHPDLDRALCGGSSIVSALTGAVLLRFWMQKLEPFAWLKILPALEDMPLASLALPFWAFGVAWGVYSALLPWAVQAGLPSGVEHSAGYVTNGVALLLGAGAAFAMQQFALEDSRQPHSHPAQHRKESDARFELANVLKLRESGDAEQAFALLVHETQKSVRNRETVLLFWEMAVERRQAEQAAPALHGLIKEEIRRGASARAATLWKELATHAPQTLLEPGLLVHLFPAIRSDGGEKYALLALKQALHGKNPYPLSTALAAQIAELASELDPHVATLAARRALGAADLPDETRTKLDALLARLAPAAKAPAPAARAAKAPVTKELPPAPFAEDEDRSLFGDSTDLSTTDDAAHPAPVEKTRAEELFALAPDANVEAAPLDSLLGASTADANDTALAEEDDTPKSQRTEADGADEADDIPPPPPQISSYGQDPVRFEVATPKSDDKADGAASAKAGRNLDRWLAEIGMAPPAPSPAAAPVPQVAPPLPPDFTQFMAPATEKPIAPTQAAPSTPAPAPSTAAKKTAFSRVAVKSVVPVSFEQAGLLVHGSDGNPTRLAYARIQAIALAAVGGLTQSGKPILIVDLLLNWQTGGPTPLQAVRLRSDQFDPRKLCPQTDSPLQAIFEFAKTLQAQSNATLLSGFEQPGKVPVFASLALYSEQVLGVDATPAP